MIDLALSDPLPILLSQSQFSAVTRPPVLINASPFVPLLASSSTVIGLRPARRHIHHAHTPLLNTYAVTPAIN